MDTYGDPGAPPARRQCRHPASKPGAIPLEEEAPGCQQEAQPSCRGWRTCALESSGWAAQRWLGCGRDGPGLRRTTAQPAAAIAGEPTAARRRQGVASKLKRVPLSKIRVVAMDYRSRLLGKPRSIWRLIWRLGAGPMLPERRPRAARASLCAVAAPPHCRRAGRANAIGVPELDD